MGTRNRNCSRLDRKLLLFRIFHKKVCSSNVSRIILVMEKTMNVDGNTVSRFSRSKLVPSLAEKTWRIVYSRVSFVVERASIKCCFCFLSVGFSWCRSNRSKARKLFFRENFRRKLFLFAIPHSLIYRALYDSRLASFQVQVFLNFKAFWIKRRIDF